MRAARHFAVLAAGLSVAGCGGAAATKTTSLPSPPRPVSLFVEGTRVAVVRPHAARHARLPARVTVRKGRARLVVAVRGRPARREIARALAARRRRLDLPFVPVSSSIAIRPVRQVLHNDCEATSLSMLLSAAGVHVSQLALQARIPQSRPVDPEPVAGSTLFRWGDPERGFVGRVDGSGPEGGFGVYEPPIEALAARYGVHLTDLHGRSVAAVRAAVLAGRPVLAWVGLSAGPYVSWLTPSGHEITVDFGEHAVVLVGASQGGFLVNNPLSGREFWSSALFSYRWQLLGRRALELRP